MTTWLTADTHFDHYNILKYCARPFDTIEDMNAALINNWNAVVQEGDLVFHLGDFAFIKNDQARAKELLTQLKGRIHLVYGNHDRPELLNQAGFKSITKVRNLYHHSQKIILTHRPPSPWDSLGGCYWLYGHTHEGPQEGTGAPVLNIGVDRWDYTPISLEKIITLLP